jgi:hypothetical protein
MKLLHSDRRTERDRQGGTNGAFLQNVISNAPKERTIKKGSVERKKGMILGQLPEEGKPLHSVVKVNFFKFSINIQQNKTHSFYTKIIASCSFC